ncbi:D-alanine--D-alanine ligase [Desulfovibrio mangrovi]|uniref:D-alanine--D-alanine ligase family protein n=1 Tax=Desulfovibrio mangrovi TaxID=2976983 RepID=UPI00224515DC|nr:D-alanine--D-alanine ligase [Desulfovibrio mangrovi]UZP67073.1 D-alanine--D-alanine ligase [Desulfovibrio mangrovi]
MLVGLTYDLKADYLAMGYSEEDAAEFDSPATIEAIEEALQSHGFLTERVGALPSLASALLQGKRWDLVFNIAEGLHGFGRESQTPALLDYYGIPYVFSDPMTLGVCLHKGVTKHVVRDKGVPTADFAVVEDVEDAYAVNLPYPLFVKPVAEGTGIGVGAASKVRNQQELVAACEHVLARYNQPALVETFLSGRELTVGIVGTGRKARAIGALEVVFASTAESDAYGYVNKAEYLERMQYTLAEDAVGRYAAEVALDAWRALGCRDGGRVDVRLDAGGVPNFIEVNPLAGLHPVNSDLPILCYKVGMSYRQLIGEIMTSALERNGLGTLPIPMVKEAACAAEAGR